MQYVGMAITSVDTALSQYNANLNWHQSQAGAEAALEAARYLLANRAQGMSTQGSSLNFEALQQTVDDITQFLGAKAPRAFGRSRRVSASLPDAGGMQ